MRCLTLLPAMGWMVFLCLWCCASENTSSVLLDPPPAGTLYHGVYPGGKTGHEDDITPKDVDVYEQYVGKQVAWVYFSHNWFNDRAFPMETAQWIQKRGAVPFIRLMLRSSAEKGYREKLYTLQAIIDGAFDKYLALWGQEAKRFGAPLLVEYGTECNGSWFPWNGKWHGGGRTKGFGDRGKPDGPERFVAAFRHIVRVIREQGADNITWVFHLDSNDFPDKKWNRFENYYPGDDVVDWIGVSAYGPQTPMEDEGEDLLDMMDRVYPRLNELAADKPIIVLEFGCSAGSSVSQPEVWADKAFDSLFSNRWPRVIGFSWWNERWENDDHPKHNTTMCVQDIPPLAQCFRDQFSVHAVQLVERPIFD